MSLRESPTGKTGSELLKMEQWHMNYFQSSKPDWVFIKQRSNHICMSLRDKSQTALYNYLNWRHLQET